MKPHKLKNISLADAALCSIAHSDSSELLDKIPARYDVTEYQDWHNDRTWIRFADDSALCFEHPRTDVFYDMTDAKLSKITGGI
jgi:hypothetical protein